ncbi:hypothetical protein COOONC_18415 [Cooperia oncophora]
MRVSIRVLFILLTSIITVFGEEEAKEETTSKDGSKDEGDLSKSDNSTVVLPRCKHINPYKELTSWMEYTMEGCNHTSAQEELSDEDRTYYQFGFKSFAFDVMASDRLGMRRDLGHQCHELCHNTTFNAEYTTSVVIIHHNEALSVLLRMLTGIRKSIYRLVSAKC